MNHGLSIPGGFLVVISIVTLLSVLIEFDEMLKPQKTRNKNAMTAQIDTAIQYIRWANLLTQPVVLAGAISMTQHKREGLCNIAAAIASVPCLGSCYSFPFGIWAIVQLGRPENKELFRQRRNGW